MGFVIYAFVEKEGETGVTEEVLHATDAFDRDFIVINPKLKIELNKAGQLSFTIAPSHPLYNSLKIMKTQVHVDYDDLELFRGRVLSVKTNFFNQKEVTCEGCLAYLNDTVGWNYNENCTLAQFYQQCINNHNARLPEGDYRKFRMGVALFSDSEAGITSSYGEQNYSSTYSALDSAILKDRDAYIFASYDKMTKGIYVDCYSYDIMRMSISDNEQVIEYGNNLIDISKEINGDDLFTVLIPVGKNRTTISQASFDPNALAAEGLSHTWNTETLEHIKGVEEYGKIYKAVDFGDYEDATALLNRAREYFKKNYKGAPKDFKIKAVDMHLMDDAIKQIRLGGGIRVVSPPHGIDENLVVSAIDYDIMNPSQTEYTINDPSQEKIVKRKAASSITSETASSSGSSRGGGGGGGGVGSTKYRDTEIQVITDYTAPSKKTTYHFQISEKAEIIKIW